LNTSESSLIDHFADNTLDETQHNLPTLGTVTAQNTSDSGKEEDVFCLDDSTAEFGDPLFVSSEKSFSLDDSHDKNVPEPPVATHMSSAHSLPRITEECETGIEATAGDTTLFGHHRMEARPQSTTVPDHMHALHWMRNVDTDAVRSPNQSLEEALSTSFAS
jgi:hypothetical protein